MGNSIKTCNRRQTASVLAAVLASLAATSCALEGTDEGGPDTPNLLAEDIGVQAQALDPDWAEGPFTWRQGFGASYLRPDATHHCVLTKIAGDFDGGGEKVELYKSGANWYLGGQSQQTGIEGKAYCFAKDKFLANGTARWSSDNIWLWASSGGKHSNQVDAWWGDGTTMLSGVAGTLRWSGTRAFVNQSNGPFTPSIVRVEVSDSYLWAQAHSFFAGTPSSGVLAKYWGGEYTANSSYRCVSGNGDHEVPMAPVNDAMCHFTHVGGGGDWDGGGEFVEIYPKHDGSIERWFLRAHSGYCNSRTTIARARCYRRDQR